MTPEHLRGALGEDRPQRVHRIVPDGVEAGIDALFLEPDGDFVLYWMRVAVRAHENPALDVALELGRALDRPVFVYHALSERYDYASDRHHRFILEGARDVQAELAERGIGYAFHLERPGHRGPHLVELAGRAAAVVTEDFPTAPIEDWTWNLAEAAGREVWAVDAACHVPMRTVRADQTLRAFRFRKAVQCVQEARLRTSPREIEPAHPAFVPELPFDAIDLETADFAELIATCEIDHTVGPIAHTPGGRRAGYARWDRFRSTGLSRYAGARNDALRPGVSRMSAYLHYGHVSPFRIAREAWEHGGKGAEKYLDELLVWRELAWAFCAAHPEHQSLDALPDWAVETLKKHEGDARTVYSWERLARGRTGDTLWDAAQHSLLRHGELHNNVRMTWGKALLGWSRDAQHALDRLVDLNHRYALDGRDPSSYGGLLWCLGQFDRPFEPEQPVVGTVRPRDTRVHAKRLPPSEYGARTARAAWPDPPRVAVVGAGLSGLMAARALVDHGLEVIVFDKGRRPGGRMNTREHGERRFDHGTQFFTIRDSRLLPYLESWIDDGVVREWTGELVRSTAVGIEPATPGPRWVGTPGMVTLPQHLAGDLAVRTGVRVAAIEATTRDAAAGSGASPLRLLDDTGTDLGTFDRVVLALPAPQIAPLVESLDPELARRVAAVQMAPCWSAMVDFDGPTGVRPDGAFVADSPLTWAAREPSKPGRRSGSGEAWVLHGGPEWTAAHLETDPVDVIRVLVEAFRERFGASSSRVAFSRAHLWRYALAAGPVDGLSLHAPEAGLVACGDWCSGGRVEGALLSGMAAAGRILREAPEAPGNPLGTGRAAVHPEQLSLIG